MDPIQWEQRFGESQNDVTYLFTTNREVQEYNHKRLNQLQKPIALVEAKHTGRSKKMSSDKFCGLESSLFLARDAKVVMTSNVCQPAGLCNGAVGEVKDIVYHEGETAPSLP